MNMCVIPQVVGYSIELQLLVVMSLPRGILGAEPQSSSRKTSTQNGCHLSIVSLSPLKKKKKTWSHYVVLTGLKLAMQTRLALNSERFWHGALTVQCRLAGLTDLLLPPSCWNDRHKPPYLAQGINIFLSTGKGNVLGIASMFILKEQTILKFMYMEVVLLLIFCQSFELTC